MLLRIWQLVDIWETADTHLCRVLALGEERRCQVIDRENVHSTISRLIVPMGDASRESEYS